jgi:hypothetical protein
MTKPSDYLEFCEPDGGHVRMQVRSLKDKLAVVLNKTANDDRLVSALRAENASLKKVRLRAYPRAAVSVLTKIASIQTNLKSSQL